MVVWYVPVLYGEKQQEEYIVKERRTADLGRMVPLWMLVYCDWDNQVHKKTTHLHERRNMCLYSNNCHFYSAPLKTGIYDTDLDVCTLSPVACPMNETKKKYIFSHLGIATS